jgi:S-adenosylmethionine:tRNA ribosyltransferase-isomerase
MRTSDFDYHLPKRMIAQMAVEPRDASRLLVLHRESGAIEHRIFRDVGEYLRAGDLVVLNQTRVIPARMHARKETGGRVELLLLRKHDGLTWSTLVGGRGVAAGKKLDVEGGPMAEVIAVEEGAEPIEPFFGRAGNVPLPPYIHEELRDPERYQTVYAREPGSAAAPTAGLHFTSELLHHLQAQGVGIGYVTLHVGLDTFAPVVEHDAARHRIHSEWCEVPPSTATAINRTRDRAARIVAVGTTSVRALESASRSSDFVRSQKIAPFSGDTDLYILPGFPFRLVDVMITNFHLPKSTLLMLVSAFAGRELVLEAYEIAKREGYRFYSFGDAMLIL